MIVAITSLLVLSLNVYAHVGHVFNIESPEQLTANVRNTFYLANNKKYTRISKHLIELGENSTLADVIEFSNTTTVIRNPAANIVYTNLTSFPFPKDINFSDVTSPNGKPIEHSWVQLRAINKYQKWSSWYPVSDCYTSTGNQEYELSWDYSFGWSTNPNSFIRYIEAFASINENIERYIIRSGDKIIKLPASTLVQLLIRQKVESALIQAQHCSHGFDRVITCTPWSDFTKVYAPLAGDNNYELEVNTNKDMMSCPH